MAEQRDPPPSSTLPEVLRCRCPQCNGCRYILLRKLSQQAGLCFSCRKDVHAGRPM